MGIYAGGTFQPTTKEVLEQKGQLLKFARKFPKEINPVMWTKMIREITQRLNLTPEKIDHYFFTQLNINSIHETLDNLGIEHERAHTIMDHYGYTGSACIPMALDDAKQKGKLKEGDLVAFIGSGGGLAFASAIFRL